MEMHSWHYERVVLDGCITSSMQVRRLSRTQEIRTLGTRRPEPIDRETELLYALPRSRLPSIKANGEYNSFLPVTAIRAWTS